MMMEEVLVVLLTNSPSGDPPEFVAGGEGEWGDADKEWGDADGEWGDDGS